MDVSNFVLTNVDLKTAHILAVELCFGVFGVSVGLVLNERVGVLLDRSEER